MGLNGGVKKTRTAASVETGNALGTLGGAVNPTLASLFAASVSKQAPSYDGCEANQL